MRVVWGFDNPPQLRNAVATVGSYDGVHRGHRILLDEVVRLAKECGGESVVLTFEPHPRITLGNDEGLRLLSTFEEKCRLLEAVGIDYVVVIPFDKAFSQLSRETFIDDYLVGRLGIKQLIVGYNHHFGHNKEGNHSFLLQHGALQVVEIAQYTDNGNKVSSTTIRKALSEGDIALARQMLGHPYIIIGMADEKGVLTTDKLKLLPTNGEYVCRIDGEECRCKVIDGSIKQSCKFSQKIEIEL
uniref:FAD synthetase n=1 Tax=Alistipes sp. TaxID=1872444 RepID=UPI0040565388